MKKPRVLKIKDRKLGKQKALGLWYEKGLIEVDPRQDSKERLDTMIHEGLHEAGIMDEDYVKKISGIVTSLLWEDGYRRIEK